MRQATSADKYVIEGYFHSRMPGPLQGCGLGQWWHYLSQAIFFVHACHCLCVSICTKPNLVNTCCHWCGWKARLGHIWLWLAGDKRFLVFWELAEMSNTTQYKPTQCSLKPADMEGEKKPKQDCSYPPLPTYPDSWPILIIPQQNLVQHFSFSLFSERKKSQFRAPPFLHFSIRMWSLHRAR